MNKGIEIAVGVAALISTLVTGTIVVESRYARAADVQQQLDSLYARTLKIRILELQLKPSSEFTPSDKALLDHLQQELREATSK